MFTTEPVLVAAVSLWVAVYTGSLARYLWRQGNRRGAIGAGALALCGLVLPTGLRLLRLG